MITALSFAQRIDNKIENPVISKTFSRYRVYCANPKCQRTVAIFVIC